MERRVTCGGLHDIKNAVNCRVLRNVDPDLSLKLLSTVNTKLSYSKSNKLQLPSWFPVFLGSSSLTHLFE